MKPTAVRQRFNGLLSEHAEQRAKQRGIRSKTLCDLYELSDFERHVGQGCVAIGVSRQRQAQLRDEGIDVRRLDALDRLVAIVGANERLVTVYRQDCRRRKRNVRRRSER
jgi:hypothetical protein